ncbi:hypothetical protein AAL29_13340 [Salmonella enterica subsp. enterica serovar Heidelberg]|nr:hypothetical protein [Salmonella enterica subsp. enterica serovar Heidelberg]
MIRATGYENKGKNSVQRYIADDEGKAAYLDWFDRYSASKVRDPSILRLQSSFQWQASEQRWYITLEIETVREDQLPVCLKEQREQINTLLAQYKTEPKS